MLQENLPFLDENRVGSLGNRAISLGWWCIMYCNQDKLSTYDVSANVSTEDTDGNYPLGTITNSLFFVRNRNNLNSSSWSKLSTIVLAVVTNLRTN